MTTIKELLQLAYEINDTKLYLRVIVELSEYRQHLLSIGAKWGAWGEEVKAIENANYIHAEINKLIKKLW